MYDQGRKMFDPEKCLDVIRKHGFDIMPGLTKERIKEIESYFGFTFPFDYAALLVLGVPMGERFPDWHKAESSAYLSKMMKWPYEGLAFDVEHNNFWLPCLGIKPNDLKAAQGVLKEFMDQLAPLVPIYSHRYISSEFPNIQNNILSVYQADVIYCGTDLTQFIENEFEESNMIDIGNTHHYTFWTEIIT